MKSSIRHGAVVRCDMVTVSHDGTKHSKECDARFISYSVASVIREQAASSKWARVPASRVMWPGEPPVDGSKKVDLCPGHSKLAMTLEEAKAKRKAAREKLKAEKKAAAASAKEPKQKKPRKPRKPKAEQATA